MWQVELRWMWMETDVYNHVNVSSLHWSVCVCSHTVHNFPFTHTFTHIFLLMAGLISQIFMNPW